jgi:hypothetical protein
LRHGLPAGLKAEFHGQVVGRRADRYTVGQLETDLRRIVRRMIDSERATSHRLGHDTVLDHDPDLASLSALHDLRAEIDLLIDRRIITARRRRNRPPATWAAIGAVLGMTGQAVGQHAHTHHLAVDAPTAADYERMLATARRLRGRREPETGEQGHRPDGSPDEDQQL